MVREALAAAHGFAPEQVEITVIRTSGDRIQDRPLAEAGGKGLFTKEIEEALLAGSIDLAVHSSKDMPTVLPDGRLLDAFLPREDARDAFISRKAKSLRPDLKVVTLRGNVETRLRKLDGGEADATLLAVAGLKRLGLLAAATMILDLDAFLPAVGQGAIGIETRADDEATRTLVTKINDVDTAMALAAERAFLAVLDGSCRTPIAGHAQVRGGTVHFRGMILRPDGSEVHEAVRDGRCAAAAELGAAAGRELKDRAGLDFFAPS